MSGSGSGSGSEATGGLAAGLARRRAFVMANTRPRRPESVPELWLHLTDEVTPLWESTEEELGEAGVPPPFWAFAWAGGQGVARFVLDHPSTVAGLRVLDLATGSGLCAIAAMQAGATHVLASDLDPFACAAAGLNAEVNGVAIDVTDDDLTAGDPPDVDVILAGDICYERLMAARLTGWLRTAHERGIRVVLGDPRRSYLPSDGLRQLAAYDVATDPDVEESRYKHTLVYTFA